MVGIVGAWLAFGPRIFPPRPRIVVYFVDTAAASEKYMHGMEWHTISQRVVHGRHPKRRSTLIVLVRQKLNDSIGQAIGSFTFQAPPFLRYKSLYTYYCARGSARFSILEVLKFIVTYSI